MKLVRGVGSLAEGACWMSGIHYYTRSDESWSDRPRYVSRMIRMLSIALNDWCGDGEREDLIGPHYFTPLGTATGSDDNRYRGYLCADRLVRVFAPLALGAVNLTEEAKALRDLVPVVDAAMVKMGTRIAVAAKKEMVERALEAAAVVGLAADAAEDGTLAWISREEVRRMARKAGWAEAWTAERAAALVVHAAREAESIAIAGNPARDAEKISRSVKRELLQLILDCCAVGTKKEIEVRASQGESWAPLLELLPETAVVCVQECSRER